MMGKRIAVQVMVWGCVALVGLAAFGWVLQQAHAPVVSSGVQEPVCEEYMPHADYQYDGEFNTWVVGVVDATHAVNVEFISGVWYADGVVVGYSGAEDGAIYNHEECVP